MVECIGCERRFPLNKGKIFPNSFRGLYDPCIGALELIEAEQIDEQTLKKEIMADLKDDFKENFHDEIKEALKEIFEESFGD